MLRSEKHGKVVCFFPVTVLSKLVGVFSNFKFAFSQFLPLSLCYFIVLASLCSKHQFHLSGEVGTGALYSSPITLVSQE